MRRWVLLIVALIAITGVAGGVWWVLVGEPQARRRALIETVDAFTTAWEREEWAALAARVRPPARPAVDGHQALVNDLAVEGLRVEPRSVEVDTDTAQADVEVTVDLAGLEPWRYDVRLDLAWGDGVWEVTWRPEMVHPEFVEDGGFVRRRSFDTRGSILDREGVPLVGGTEAVSVGIEPQRITDEAQVVEALVTHAGAIRERVEALLARDDLEPDWFYPVVDLPRQRFDEVDPELRPIPGIIFRASEGRAEATGGFALHLLGRSEALTAEQAEEIGRGYEEGDVAGTFGLERALDERLGGRPETAISVVDANGEEVAVVHRLEGVDADDVRTTLDRAIQQAAEDALTGVEQPAALVAVDVASMEVRAAVSRPLEGLNRALVGRYPPGSTFKVVTTAALLGDGLDAESPLDCPRERTVGGRTFRNAGELELGEITLREALARSCNTAYVGAAPERGEAIEAAARAFGFDETAHDVPLSSFGGTFPEPDDVVALAAAAIGQARVEASPLHMATVAAAVASGHWRPATLLADSDAPRASRDIPGDTSVLGDLMRAVVATGTGTAAQVAGEPVAGKTGSAEFGTGEELETHAWFIGFRGGLAFAVLVEGGGAGGEVAAPIAARFLGALP